MPSCTLWVTPQFLCKMKVLKKMHNRGKFHLYSICGCEVIKFRMCSWWWSVYDLAHFWKFFGANSLKYSSILLKFGPELVFQEIKTLFEKFFENSNFYGDRTYSIFTFFSLFVELWPRFSPWTRRKSKKVNKVYTYEDKTTLSTYLSIPKSRPYPLSIFQEKYDYFLSYFGCFLLKGPNQNLTYLIAVSQSLGMFQSKNFGSKTFQVRGYNDQRSFFFNFRSTFSSLAAFLGTIPTFQKKMSLIYRCRI